MFVRFCGALAAFVLVSLAAVPADAQKVGYVDSRRIIQEMPGRVQVENTIRVEIEKLGLRQQVMVDSLNKLMSYFERDSTTMTPDERSRRFAAMQTYDADYRDTLEVLEVEAQQVQAEAMAPLFDQVRLALEDIRVAEGFAMIFDIGNQANPIVAMDKNLDLSDRVIARIRQMPAAPATTPSAAAPINRPGPVPQSTGVTRQP